MICFAAELPVSQEREVADLIALCKTWVLGSPHTGLVSRDFDELEGPEWSFSKGDEAVQIAERVTDQSHIGGMRYVRKESAGLEWTTEIVGSKEETSFWVAVRVSCESNAPLARLPQAKKPYLIRQIIQNLGGGLDGALTVSEAPTFLGNADIDVASSQIMGRSGNHLPVVYVSAAYSGGPVVNPEELARHLSGLAHVVVEPNRPFSLRLMLEVDHQNVYGGAVGIYWPDGAGRRTFYLGSLYPASSDIEKAVTEEIRRALANRRPMPNCSWSYLRESMARSTYNRLKAEGSTELAKYIEAFDGELEAKDQRLAEAEADIRRLRSENAMLDARCNGRAGRSLLSYGKEQEFFDSEITDVVVDALDRYKSQVRPGSRRQHIIDDLVSANPKVGEETGIRDCIKGILDDYRDMSAKCRKELEQLGFTITDDGKHYKAVFRGDARYKFSIPKTSSDHRAGKNLASDIVGTLL